MTDKSNKLIDRRAEFEIAYTKALNVAGYSTPDFRRHLNDSEKYHEYSVHSAWLLWQATIDAVNADKQSVSAKVLLDIVYSEQFEPRDRLQRIASNLIMSKATTIDREDVIAGTGDYIKRSELEEILRLAVCEMQKRCFDLSPEHEAQICAINVGQIVEDAINSLPSIAVNAQTNNGWKLVPIEPTEAMLKALRGSLEDWATDEGCYKAMLNAAPNNANSIETNSAPVENDCDCGCNEPFATEPIQALEFLASRFEFAGVGEAVATSYAKDIRKILANTAPPSQSVNEAP